MSNVGRTFTALKLGKDLEACAALLAGEPVDKDRLDPDGLAWALERRYVRLERPIDGFPQLADYIKPIERAS